MLDVPVAEVVLQRPCVVAIVGELKPTGMAQHVRVDRKGHLATLPCPPPPGNHAVGILRVRAAQLTKNPYLVTADRMYAGNPVLDSVHMQATLGQLNLLPLQVAVGRTPSDTRPRAR